MFLLQHLLALMLCIPMHFKVNQQEFGIISHKNMKKYGNQSSIGWEKQSFPRTMPSWVEAQK